VQKEGGYRFRTKSKQKTRQKVTSQGFWGEMHPKASALTGSDGRGAGHLPQQATSPHGRLLESAKRQFAPACGRFTNTAKDGPTQTPGLVECDAGFFCLGDLLGNELVNTG
jgi:hypothetical protein